MKIIKAVFFDFDGTIFRLKIDWNEIRRKLTIFFQRYGLKSDFKPLFKEVIRLLEELKKIKISPEKIELIQSEINELIKKEEIIGVKKGQIVKNVSEILNFLKKNKVAYGIITQNSSSVVNMVIKKYRLPYPDIIIGREEAGFKGIKPNIIAGEMALKKIKYNKKEIIYIGDKLSDWKFGRDLGVKTIIFNKKQSNYKKINFVNNLLILKDLINI